MIRRNSSLTKGEKTPLRAPDQRTVLTFQLDPLTWSCTTRGSNEVDSGMGPVAQSSPITKVPLGPGLQEMVTPKSESQP